MSQKSVIVLGWEITRQPHHLYSDPPSTIRLHKLGESSTTWFTPDELRSFIAALGEQCRRTEDETRAP